METKWLKTFIVAAEHENFRKASEVLYLTQPAVTKHIQRLEEYLQVSLFEREGKAVRLSAAGLRFLPIAKALFAQYESGMAHFESWKQGYDKQLTIAVAPQIASSILPAILKAFLLDSPNIEVFINVVNSYEVNMEVANGKADVGLTRIEPQMSALHSEIAFKEPVVLIAPYDAELDNEASLLQSYRLITNNHPGYWDELLNRIKSCYPTVQTMPVNQIEVTKRFIEQGLGISYLPYSMVEKELEEQLLKIIEPDRVPLPISQTYIVSKAMTAETAKFIRFFKATVAQI